MTAQLVGKFTPGSAEWHAARANGLGGSEIAAVLGLSPFESRFGLWHRKRGLLDPQEETPEMEWGKRLEPVILQKFVELHPEWDVDTDSATFCAADRPWQIANPDALGYADPACPPDMTIIEAKFSLFGDEFGEPGTDEIPVYYRTQAMWYADVLEVETVRLAVLVGGHDYREYIVTYNADEAAVLRQAALIFLDDIANDVRPDIDDSLATYQAVKELHPEIDGTDIDIDGTLAARFIDSRIAKKEAEQHAQQVTSELADAMGNARRAVWDQTVIATRQARGDNAPYLVAARNLVKGIAA